MNNGEAGQGMPAMPKNERWRRRSMNAHRGPSGRSARTIVKAMKVLGTRQAKPSEYVLDAGKDAAAQWLLDMGIGYHLYRMYASDGTLLYIGKTGPRSEGLESHYLRKPWIFEVAWIDTEDEHLDEIAASAAEQEAVRRERPKYNRTHNRRSKTSHLADAS
jgi:hypothetical protein